MFGIFTSPERKARDSAASWIEAAQRVWKYRRDLLSAKDGAELQGKTEELRRRLREKAEPAKLQLSIQAIEDVLRRTGGVMYPKTALVEYTEFFLVAAIAIIGFKTFFLQPFKIPTNSMWPTYNGMTAQVFQTRAEEPGPVAVALRLVAFGAWPHRLDAPVDGEIEVPIPGMNQERRAILPCRTVAGHTWLVLPAKVREYTLFVSGAPVTVKLPMDFDFDWAVCDAFFADQQITSPTQLLAFINSRPRSDFVTRDLNGVPTLCLRTHRLVKAGDRVISFDERAGDMPVVDRVSYNFVRPKGGQSFVFATVNIPTLHEDQYLIKRLVGTPGDTLSIHAPVLFRNGQPISGAEAFDKNARREGNYHGYTFGPESVDASHRLGSPDDVIKVPANSYFGMGDNSINSGDSRYWGFVPAKEVIGKPLFVYYPFTSHWGPAH